MPTEHNKMIIKTCILHLSKRYGEGRYFDTAWMNAYLSKKKDLPYDEIDIDIGKFLIGKIGNIKAAYKRRGVVVSTEDIVKEIVPEVEFTSQEKRLEAERNVMVEKLRTLVPKYAEDGKVKYSKLTGHGVGEDDVLIANEIQGYLRKQIINRGVPTLKVLEGLVRDVDKNVQLVNDVRDISRTLGAQRKDQTLESRKKEMSYLALKYGKKDGSISTSILLNDITDERDRDIARSLYNYIKKDNNKGKMDDFVDGEGVRITLVTDGREAGYLRRKYATYEKHLAAIKEAVQKYGGGKVFPTTLTKGYYFDGEGKKQHLTDLDEAEAIRVAGGYFFTEVSRANATNPGAKTNFKRYIQALLPGIEVKFTHSLSGINSASDLFEFFPFFDDGTGCVDSIKSDKLLMRILSRLAKNEGQYYDVWVNEKSSGKYSITSCHKEVDYIQTTYNQLVNKFGKNGRPHFPKDDEEMDNLRRSVQYMASFFPGGSISESEVLNAMGFQVNPKPIEKVDVEELLRLMAEAYPESEYPTREIDTIYHGSECALMLVKYSGEIDKTIKKTIESLGYSYRKGYDVTSRLARKDLTHQQYVEFGEVQEAPKRQRHETGFAERGVKRGAEIAFGIKQLGGNQGDQEKP